MPENSEQPEISEQTEEELKILPGEIEYVPPEHTTGLTQVDDSIPVIPSEPGTQLDTSMQVKDADVPWQVVQLQEGLPEDIRAKAYFVLNDQKINHILVCANGFYGLHEGKVQRLPVKVLVDNI